MRLIDGDALLQQLQYYIEHYKETSTIDSIGVLFAETLVKQAQTIELPESDIELAVIKLMEDITKAVTVTKTGDTITFRVEPINTEANK